MTYAQMASALKTIGDYEAAVARRQIDAWEAAAPTLTHCRHGLALYMNCLACSRIHPETEQTKLARKLDAAAPPA